MNPENFACDYLVAYNLDAGRFVSCGKSPTHVLRMRSGDIHAWCPLHAFSYGDSGRHRLIRILVPIKSTDGEDLLKLMEVQDVHDS